MFYIVTLSFLGGVLLRSFADFDLFYFYVLILVTGVAFILHRRQLTKFIALGAIFLFVGWMRFDLAQFDVTSAGQNHIAYYNESKVVITGLVVSEPDVRADQVKYVVGEGVINDVTVKGKVLVTIQLYPRYEIGDPVSFECRLRTPEEFNGFAYDKYLARKGIYSLCYSPKILNQDQTTISLPTWLKIKKGVFFVKNKFIVQVHKILPHPHSSLLSGILMGDTTGMPEYLDQAFINTGTIHIVAMSGYNITIIIILFLKIAPYLYLTRRQAWFLILPALMSFVIITGGESSVIRSVVMGLIAALATESGRLADIKRLLLLTAVIMVLINPYVLRFDVGFQLSFLATIGLVYIVPRFDKLIDWVWARVIAAREISPLARGGGRIHRHILSPAINVLNIIRESAVTTISANLAVAPILIFQFGRVSFISPVVNVAILWAIPITMAVGFIAVLVSFIFMPLGQVMSWCTWLLLEYVIEIVKFFG